MGDQGKRTPSPPPEAPVQWRRRNVTGVMLEMVTTRCRTRAKPANKDLLLARKPSQTDWNRFCSTKSLGRYWSSLLSSLPSNGFFDFLIFKHLRKSFSLFYWMSSKFSQSIVESHHRWFLPPPRPTELLRWFRKSSEHHTGERALDNPSIGLLSKSAGLFPRQEFMWAQNWHH